MRTVLAVTFAAIFSAVMPAFAEKSSVFFADYSDYTDEGKKILDRLDIKSGQFALGNGVTVTIEGEFYFLDAKDAGVVLTDAWGNPPSDRTLGMIFPKRCSPLQQECWGVELTYEDIGHVDDAEASTIDYTELLEQMQADTRAENDSRVREGYPSIELVGWAEPPKYDFKNKRLHWAKEIKFGGSPDNTLNYNIRVLGRQGVIVMNYIADMGALAEIRSSIDNVMSAVRFEAGQSYADFVPGVDKVAAFGIGGLIAGKVLAKTGLLAIALVFLKKFGVLLIVPLAWIGRMLFSRRKDTST